MTRKQWIGGIAMMVFLVVLGGCQQADTTLSTDIQPAAPAVTEPAVVVPTVPAQTTPTAPAVPAVPDVPKLPAVSMVQAVSSLVVRVNCGATQPYTDKAGNIWLPDEVKVPGVSLNKPDGMTIERTEPFEVLGVQFPEIFRTERYSMSAYEFGLPNGKYTVQLHFAETYEGITGQGQRVFSFAVQGQQTVKDFDIFKEAGGAYKAIERRFRGVEVTDEKLKIEFTSNIQNPAINGIVIIAE